MPDKNNEKKISKVFKDEKVASQLEEIIEEKVEERIEEKLQEKQNKEIENKQSSKNQEGIDRRNFMKKIGLGAAGLGAASMLPAAALDIRDSSGLNVYTDNDHNFQVDSGGDVTVYNGDLDIHGSIGISNSNQEMKWRWVRESNDDTDTLTLVSNPGTYDSYDAIHYHIVDEDVHPYVYSIETNAKLEVEGDVNPTGSGFYDLGQSDLRWDDLHVNGGTFYEDLNMIGDNLNLTVDSTTGGYPALRFEDDGELAALVRYDISGNELQLMERKSENNPSIRIQEDDRIRIVNAELNMDENSIENVNEINGQDADDLGGDIPSGLITLWSGSISNIPDGWVLCDGNNGTPDLQDRFIVGAGSSYSVDATGGSSSVTLSESEMPSHTHGVYIDDDTYFSNYASIMTGEDRVRYNDTNTTTSSGGDSSHENRPPYYALAFIMKL